MKKIKRISALLIVLSIVLSMCAFTVTAYAKSKKTMTVWTTGKVHLRKGPSKDFSSICTIPADTMLTYIGEKAYDATGVKWGKVNYNGKIGWVSGIYVTRVPGQTSAKGTIKLTGSEYIRAMPSQYAHSLGAVKKGTKVPYFRTVKDLRGITWYLIHHDGKDGWISAQYTGNSSKKSKIEAVSGRTYIRKGPGLEYKKIECMNKGQSAAYVGTTKYDDRGVAWYNVEFKGVVGWVSSRYTTRLPE